MTVPKRNFTRINTLELKALIVKNAGHQKADEYFDQLGKLLNSKISKSEFDKICIMTIGKQNIHLHNHFIRAILLNVCLAKVPPTKTGSAKNSNEQQSSSIQMQYGDAFPPTLRKCRPLATRDRKFKGRQTALGPMGKNKILASEELISNTLGLQNATELNSFGSRPPISVEEGEEVEQMAGSPAIQSRSPISAPLGVYMNFDGGRKKLSNVSLCSKYNMETCYSNGDLPDTTSLKSRLEQKLQSEGLTVTVDCVNLLNNALDSYLKRLIESSMGLAGSRSGNEHPRQRNVLLPGRNMQTATQPAGASLMDFRTAMELNPQALGPDWPIQLEKICLHPSFDE